MTTTDFLLSPFVVIVDSREQHPWTFHGLKADSTKKYRPLVVRTEVAALDTGDYSIKGGESSICIERKSMSDLYSTLGQGRERFNRELDRMAEMEQAFILIEATEWQVCNEPPRESQMRPKSVWRSLLAFEQRFGIHVHYSHSREFAERKAYRILERFYRDKMASGDAADNRFT